MGGILRSPSTPSLVQHMKKLLKERECPFLKNLPKGGTWESSSISSFPLDLHRSRKLALSGYWHLLKHWWYLSLLDTKLCKIGIFLFAVFYQLKFVVFVNWSLIRNSLLEVWYLFVVFTFYLVFGPSWVKISLNQYLPTCFCEKFWRNSISVCLQIWIYIFSVCLDGVI